MDTDEGSSNEESFRGISSCGKLFVNFVSVGLQAGMEGFRPVLALRQALHFFFYISGVTFYCVPILPSV